MVYDKNRLLDEVDTLNQDNTTLAIRIKDNEAIFNRERDDLENYISSLKGEVELNQVNYVREKEKSLYRAGDLDK